MNSLKIFNTDDRMFSLIWDRSISISYNLTFKFGHLLFIRTLQSIQCFYVRFLCELSNFYNL